jgi:D-tyrosyl-tRNA(Tyr) deacylase
MGHFCIANFCEGFRSSPMKAVIQRVETASVTVEGRIVSEIGAGLLIFLGVEEGDTENELVCLAGKVSRLRIFSDDAGAMNRSIQDIGGEALVVSQFTLLADTRKGNRPSFIRAAAPAIAREMYEKFCVQLEQEIGKSVGRGIFGAHMVIGIVNDGPVTICIDTRE